MLLKFLLISLAAAGLKLCHCDVSTLGVPPSKLLLYQPNKDFTCFDGSLNIPFNSVNDDFCDCLDGSDEPGTSACATAIFYCVNNGYYSVNIPSSRVNDGICDCCDGSDEYIIKNCSDSCNILGAQALAEAERRAELLNQGNSLRLQLSNSGKQLRQQKQEHLIELKKDLSEAEKVKKDAEDLKLSSESKESAALEVYNELEEKGKVAAAEKEMQDLEEQAKEAFRSIDTNEDSLLVPDEILDKLKTLKSSETKTESALQEEVKFMMNLKTELKFEEFMENTWHYLKSLLTMDTSILPPPEEEEEEEISSNDNQRENKPVEEEEVDADNEEKTDDTDIDDGQDPENEDGGEFSESSPTHIDSKYDEETKHAISEANKARQNFEDAERAYKDIERDITRLKEYLDKDFGPDDEFSPLEGQCFTYSDREYNYKLCPFDQVVQSGKQGGSETRLGVWKSWESSGDYNAMLYDRGQSCWNGPQRSVKVHLYCGLENEVFAVAEPNKCEYILDFKTPAACRPTRAYSREMIRDEL